MEYNPYNWFWLKGSGKVYSSKHQEELASDDSRYLEFLKFGGQATPYPCDAQGEESEQELGAVLSQFGLSLYAPTLAEIKAQAREALKAYRQQVEYGGFILNGQRWDSEQKDELRLNSAVKIFEAGLTEYPGWKIADGVYITLTPQLLQQATIAFMQHTGAAFALEAAKLGQIEALDSSEAVLAWLEGEMKEGWPGGSDV